MRRNVRTLAAAILAPLLVAFPVVALATPAAAASTGIVINEVESSGGSPGDWIELTNTGDASQDVGGLILKDNDDTHQFVIPAGTTIAAGGFAAFDVDVTGGFGLGSADTARLFESDGTTLVDSYSWSAHASTSYGRCPDGTGAFVTTVGVTKGAANACELDPADVLVINEIESSGGAGVVDWVELYNTNAASVDASGLVLRDNDDTHAVVIPDGTTIAGHGFLAVEVDVATGFGLGSSDSARLFATDGTTLIDSYTWTGAHATTTYGRCPDGVGGFEATATATKGAANDCVPPAGAADIQLNEVESNGGTPGDWVEFYNTGASAVDLSGWIFRDEQDTVEHTYTLPAGSVIAAGGYLVLDEAQFGYGLGTPDSARLFLPDGTTVVDSYAWTPHAATSYARCPDGSGEFATSTTVTKGAANDCTLPLRINEVETQGAPDWIELTNTGTASIDASGLILKDSDDAHAFAIPAGTTLAAGAIVAIDLTGAGSFGLGDADSARLFAADGTTLIDSYAWTGHATTSWGRCPDGTGDFAATEAETKGTANDCIGVVGAEAWPGGAGFTDVDVAGTFGEDMSGLDYQASGVSGTYGTLWAVENGNGLLYQLTWDGTVWEPMASAALHYGDGTGTVDSEGVTLVDGDPSGGVYVASERNNDASGTSRPSILRYDVSGLTGTGGSLSATNEWNLAADLPAGIGANAGLEGITWVPDAFLTAQGLLDQGTGSAYDPADYPGHGTGLFFVGLEANGAVYAYALSTDGSADLIATIDSGFEIVADLDFDAATGLLWAVCDEACDGRTATLEVAQDGALDGSFQITHVYERPAGTANLANEGFAISSQELCVNDLKPVFYANDNADDGHALRAGTIACDSDDPTPPTDPVPPTEGQLTPELEGGITGPATAMAGQTITINIGGQHVGEQVDGWIFSTPVHLGTEIVSAASTISVTIPATTSAGVHRIAVVGSDGVLIGWLQLTVLPSGLAVTGVATVGMGIYGALALLAGAVLLIVVRRRARDTGKRAT